MIAGRKQKKIRVLAGLVHMAEFVARTCVKRVRGGGGGSRG